MKTWSLLSTSTCITCIISKIGNILLIVSGGKFYGKDGERRGYEPEVFSRIFWEQTKAEEEEERFAQSIKFRMKDEFQYIDYFPFVIIICIRKGISIFLN